MNACKVLYQRKHFIGGQMFNHFAQNHELTNKNSFRNNVNSLRDNLQRPSTPMTYDLGRSEDLKFFRWHCVYFQALKVLNKLKSILVEKDTEKSAAIDCKVRSSTSREELQTDIFSQQSSRQSKDQCQLVENLLDLIKLMKSCAENRRGQRGVAQISVTKEPLRLLNSIKASFGLNTSEIKEKAFIFQLRPLPQTLKRQLLSLHEIVSSESYTHFKYGLNNVWIIKPVGVSRGTGIYLQNNFEQLCALNKCHGKIIQKYIQRPFILYDRVSPLNKLVTVPGYLKNKFDIRQWVLVRSFEPLDAFIFDKFYCRLCSQSYQQGQIQNLQKHLTNFSLFKSDANNQNKTHISFGNELEKKTLQRVAEFEASTFKSIQQNCHSFNKTILLEEELKKHLYEILGESGNRIFKKIKMQIQSQVWKTLQCVKTKFTSNYNCFEVYGFDILLDDTLKPHVLEVNLSPACQSREGLDSYLSEMALGLVEMIQEWSGMSPNQNSQPTFRNHWKKLFPLKKIDNLLSGVCELDAGL